jgi:sugar transferase (PEP-CTERM/EpsH1 system associated)
VTALQTNIPAAAPSPPRRRFLLLVHRVPYPPDKGDRIRSYHLLAHLAQLGEVDLAFPADGPLDGPTREALERLCRRVAVVSVSAAGRWARALANLARGRSLTEGLFDAPKLRREVARWLDETPYDAVVCFSSGVLPYVRGRGLEDRLVVDLVDADSQKFFDYAERTSWLKSALLRLEGRRVRALEREAGKARAVVLATEAEANLYRGICPDAPTLAIPNGVNLEYFRPMPEVEESAGCVFVGQLDYRANVLGLEWFCQEAWPTIREALPHATFRVVGRNPVPAVQKLGELPGVEVVGTVPDVRPYVAEARVAIVPLPVARGVQNKVLEAMAMGKAVVASPSALEGLGVTPGRDALAATDPADWRRQLTELWDNASRRAELGQAARRYVEAHHRWETCLAPFGDLVTAGAPAR